jgi:hypothetical protein
MKNKNTHLGYIKTFESFDNTNKIELVDGEKIRECYLEDNYDTNAYEGTLGNSTMRYKKSQPYLDIYVENPEVCKLLVLRSNEGKVRARALVWTLTDGSSYLDRISYINEKDESLLFEWAKKNGIDNNYGSEFNQFMEGNLGEVKLKKYVFNYYPYMDTFKYLDYKRGILSDMVCDDCYALTESNGGYEVVDKEYADSIRNEVEQRKSFKDDRKNSLEFIQSKEKDYKDMKRSEIQEIINDLLEVNDFSGIEKLRTNPDLEWYWDSIDKNESSIFKYIKSFENFESFSISESKKSGVTTSLKKKSKASGIPLGILRKVFSKGMQAWNAGHRPGVAQHQWGMGRVNSFITGEGGARKADADLWTKAKAAKARKNKVK